MVPFLERHGHRGAPFMISAGDFQKGHPLTALFFIRPVIVQGAVDHHRRQPLTMRLDNPLDPLRVAVPWRVALVVDHHVVAFRPILVFKQWMPFVMHGSKFAEAVGKLVGAIQAGVAERRSAALEFLIGIR